MLKPHSVFKLNKVYHESTFSNINARKYRIGRSKRVQASVFFIFTILYEDFLPRILFSLNIRYIMPFNVYVHQVPIWKSIENWKIQQKEREENKKWWNFIFNIGIWFISATWIIKKFEEKCNFYKYICHPFFPSSSYPKNKISFYKQKSIEEEQDKFIYHIQQRPKSFLILLHFKCRQSKTSIVFRTVYETIYEFRCSFFSSFLFSFIFMHSIVYWMKIHWEIELKKTFTHELFNRHKKQLYV
jgi:hypothetical protein